MPTDRDRVGYAFDIACSECTAIVWEMQEGIAITNNYANIWPCGAEGVKNWPGKRNRLPHPVCKPLDSKRGGADGFVCRAARKPFFTASQLSDGLSGPSVDWFSSHFCVSQPTCSAEC